MNRVAEHAATTPTMYFEVGDVRYAYRELRPDNPVDRTPVLFLHRFRGTLDDWDPLFVDELAKTRQIVLFSDQEVGSSTGTAATSVDEKAQNAAAFARALGHSAIEHLSQHLRVGGHGNILIRRDLGVAMRQEIHRDAAADVRQPGQLVPPQMLIQDHAMHKERDRTGASGCVADAA